MNKANNPISNPKEASPDKASLENHINLKKGFKLRFQKKKVVFRLWDYKRWTMSQLLDTHPMPSKKHAEKIHLHVFIIQVSSRPKREEKQLPRS